jgi:Fe-S cluster assembly protein SufB
LILTFFIGNQHVYTPGFSIPLSTEDAPLGLSEDIIRFISSRRREPSWLLEWRLKAFAHWKTMKEPRWLNGAFPHLEYEALCYFSAPQTLTDTEKLDPELQRMFEKLGVPLHEQEALSGRRRVAVDAVLDSVSVATTYAQELKEQGILFCSFQDAVNQYPDLVQQYLGSVVPHTDNFFACLNAAVFSDGSFCYIPPGVECPMDLSTYFRINNASVGQFERTLLIADRGASVSYLEGCTAPARDDNQFHAAVVELVAHDDAQIRYATVQNWYPGDADGNGGILNFVTKRADCRGDRSFVSWTQVETGSAVTWKYPSCLLRGADSVGEFYSVAVTEHHQQADTGTKMIHLGPRTRSRIVSKSIAHGQSSNTYRGLVRMGPRADHAHSHAQCDSLLMSNTCRTDTFPTLSHRGPVTAHIEHEASTSTLKADALAYLQQRGLDEPEAVALLTNGFCADVFQHLPAEFAAEANRLLSLKLEGAVG